MREEQPLDHFDGQSYLTLAEVCHRYGMSSKTLRDRCDQGIFPGPCRINRKMWAVSVLSEYEAKKKALCAKAYQRLLMKLSSKHWSQ